MRKQRHVEVRDGFRVLHRLEPLLARLRDVGCQRDKAGNRQLFFDQLCSLILLAFYNPALESLHDLHAASLLPKVQKKLGCSRASIGSLSEALHLFDPAPLAEVVTELLAEVPNSPHAPRALKELAHVPTAVDGTLLLSLPLVTQACFATRQDRGWKLHTHFEVLRGVPTFARVTDASGQGEANEKAVLKASLQSDRCYITDRGYEEFALFNAIVAAKSSYVCRVRNDHGFTSSEARELSCEAKSAGVLEDTIGVMGSEKSKRIVHPNHVQRRIVIRFVEHPKRGGRRREPASHDIVLVTNLLDVPAEVIVLLYRYRWLIELFFRWLKCVMSYRHLLSHSENGIHIQMYCALIAYLQVQIATGGTVRPTKWTFKLLCLVAQGWAEPEDFEAHLRELAARAEKNQA